MNYHSYAKELQSIRDKVSDLTLADFDLQFSEQSKHPEIALILSLFLGFLGIDRFYLHQTILGLFKLLTCGGLGIWMVIDWFLITDITRDVNIKIAQEILSDQIILE